MTMERLVVLLAASRTRLFRGSQPGKPHQTLFFGQITGPLGALALAYSAPALYAADTKASVRSRLSFAPLRNRERFKPFTRLGSPHRKNAASPGRVWESTTMLARSPARGPGSPRIQGQ